MTDDGKEKKLNIDFEPFKPINTSLYLCDNKFHTEALNELLESDQRYRSLFSCSLSCHLPCLSFISSLKAVRAILILLPSPSSVCQMPLLVGYSTKIARQNLSKQVSHVIPDCAGMGS